MSFIHDNNDTSKYFCLVCYFDDIYMYGLNKFTTLDDKPRVYDNCNSFILLLLQLNSNTGNSNNNHNNNKLDNGNNFINTSSSNHNYNNNNNHNDTDKGCCYSHDVLYHNKSSIRHPNQVASE